MNPDQMKAILEAAIFVSTAPVSLEKLATLFDQTSRPSKQELRVLLQSLEADYQGQNIHLKEVANGYRFQVSGEIAQRLAGWHEEQPMRFSRALLETLSLIAYKQPVTRAEIEDIRGVAVSSHIIRTLQERDWIKPIGHRDVPGKPTLYGTTSQFLNDLNLRSLAELPALLKIQDDQNPVQLSLDFESSEV
jgi:segregation and condensation protein B